VSSRKLEDLDPRLHSLARKFAACMAEEGIPFVFTCTYRSLEEQKCLYMQGRESLEDINVERAKLGLYLITEEENIVVTKLLKGKHQERLAFDIAIALGKQPTWNLKVDVDKDGIPDYQEAGRIGRSLGLRWGGDFNDNGKADDKFVDMPHFELKV
jgi:peptidoglycan L-alanyl-D-glutamate endopeptidase CwlK